ncbi:MAG: hypothetical protein FWG56_08665 [Desulfovibrionaceae bacterium]|jgi:hypothetical protein|nr:hypothetical protein [Desulfovibrionaceae bacterium]
MDHLAPRTLSLEAAIAVTGLSRSTLWRRMDGGQVGSGGKDARNRVMLALDDVLRLTGVALGKDDIEALLRADAGDAEAQADMGALFYVAGAAKAALYWLGEAAAQGNAEAMQWLAMAHAPGGEEGAMPQDGQDSHLAVMWLARAAALGHPIAREQMGRLFQGLEEKSEGRV